MALGRTLHNIFLKRTSTFALTILVGAVFFERAFDHGADALWDRMNKGVSDTYSYVLTLFCVCFVLKVDRLDFTYLLFSSLFLYSLTETVETYQASV